MENLTKEQKKLFNEFIANIKDENFFKKIEQLIEFAKNNDIQKLLGGITEIKKAYNGNKEENQMSIIEIIEDIKTSQNNIDDIYWQIFDIKVDDKSESSALNAIKKAEEYAKKMKDNYMKFYNQTDSQGNTTEGIISKLEQACNNIEKNKDNIARFEEFYNKIFVGIQADENGNGGKLSLENYLNQKQDEIQNLINNKTADLENCLNNHSNKLEQLYKNKEKEIDELLPGATSTGLAAAYQQEKEENLKKIRWWNWIFVGSIIAFIGVFAFYSYLSFNENFTLMSFFKTLPLWIFSGFFTYYSTKQIAEHKRIASEYAYKQRLNQTYKGYETQIGKTDNDELKNQLLKIILDSAEYNPSVILDHKKGEIPSVSAIEKLIDMLPMDAVEKIKNYTETKLTKN